MDLIADHALDPSIKFKLNAKSDRSWCWICDDWVGGILEQNVVLLTFKESEVAKEFKATYEKYQFLRRNS